MTRLVRPPLREVRSRFFDSDRWQGYRPRADDILICTYPKCGTTWMQRIVGMLLAGGGDPAPVGGPWPDFRLRGPAEATWAEAEAIPGRRHLKSHLPYDALPVYEDVKVIHVARDGRDSALSFHNHLRGFQPRILEVIDQVSLADPKFGDAMPATPAAPGAYFREWLADGGAVGDSGASYWEVERSYWAARREAAMLLVHYADLKADLAGEIARIAGFLGVEAPAPVMAEIVAAAAFEAMRAQGDVLMPGAEMAWVGGAQTFLNKGLNGRWRGVFDEADLATYQAKVAAEFTPGLAAWLEGGRLVAGEPTASAD
jgi:aryl sulfotransferase